MVETNDFRNRIIEFLKEKNPYMHDHEIEERITGFWANYRNRKTPDFDIWLKKKQTDDKLEKLKISLQEKLNWLQIAEVINKEFPIHYDKSSLWWLWNHERKCYELTDETDICNIVDGAVKKNTLKGSVRSQLIEAFKRVGRKKKPAEIPKNWVQFKNKIVDIQTLQEIEPTPEYFLTNPIPHELGESEETPTIDYLLKEWAGEYALTLKQLLAYCTLRDYPVHRIFLLIGSGSNGKGTYLRLMNNFVGNENVASVEMDLIVNNQFHITKLHNRLVCQMSETNFGTLKNTSMLKKLSGGDLVGFEYKNKLPFDAYNYAKIVIATNSLPSTHDKTDGFYRRWVIIDFNKQFSEKKDVLGEIPEQEYQNLARWSVRALQGISKDRCFHNEGTIQERKEKYESKSNPLLTFMEKYYQKDENSSVPAGDFFEEFTSYLAAHGLRRLTYQVVRTMMKDEGFEYGRERFQFKGDNAIASIVGLKRRVLSELSVSAVSDVSALSSYPPLMRNQPYIGDTADTADTINEEKTTLTIFRGLFDKKYAGNVIPVEIIQKKLEFATDKWLKTMENKGYIYEKTPGWWGII